MHSVGLSDALRSLSLLSMLMTPHMNYESLWNSLIASRTLWALLYSAFFFGGGIVLFRQDRRGRALLGQIIGVAALALNALGCLFQKLWLGALVAGVVLCAEAWVMHRCWKPQGGAR